jgi:TP901 family phage tail tape measure protein
VSGALAGAAIYSIRTGKEFEEAFAGVIKTVDATDAELAQFRSSIIEMSKEMPHSAASIASVAEAAGQLGIQNEYLLDFTKVMASLGDATNMSATEAATSLARLANITQMAQSDFDRLGSSVVYLGNNFAATESEIVEMGLRIAGAGAQIGMTEPEILGVAAALSSVGIAAEAGGSSISTTLMRMQLEVETSGEMLAQFADVAGMSVEQFQTAFQDNAVGALDAFVQGLGTMEERGQSSIAMLDEMGITAIRERDALLRLAGAGDVLTRAVEESTAAWEENTALATEVERRYETLYAQTGMLKNNVDALAIAFYDSIRDELGNAVQAGIGYVQQLQQAFDRDGIQGVVREAGNVFAELATIAAEQAPRMVETAVSFIQAFAEGIYNNRSALISAAGDIAITFAQGLADLLPQSVRQPVRDAVDAISQSFQDGGLRQAINTVSNIFRSLGDAISAVVRVALPPLTRGLDLLGRNLRTIVPLVTAAVVAIKGFSITSGLTVAVKGFVGGLTLKAAAATKATAAMTALKVAMAANPIGLVLTAVAALAAGLGALALATREAEEEQDALTEAQRESLETTQELTDSMAEARNAREQTIASIEREFHQIGALRNELLSITDANGNVIAGYEERAAVITGLLSDAIGMEISLIEGRIAINGEEIASMDEVIAKIDEVIVARQAEALLASAQADMTQVHERTAEALRSQAEATSVVETAQRNLTAAIEDLATAERDLDDFLSGPISRTNAEDITSYRNAVRDATAAVEAHTTAHEEAVSVLSDVEDELRSLADEHNRYNALLEATASGNLAEINRAMSEYVSGFRGFSEEMLETSQTAVDRMFVQAEEASSLLMQVQQDASLASSEVHDELARNMARSIEEFNKLPEGMSQALERLGPEGSAAMAAALVQANFSGQLDAEGRASLESFIDGLDGLESQTRDEFVQAWVGAMAGLEGFEQLAGPAGDGVDAFLDALRAALQTSSPSRAVQEIFSGVWPGASAGLDEGAGELNEKGTSVISDFLSAIGDSGLIQGAMDIGSRIMGFFTSGVSSQANSAQAAGQSTAQSANQGAGSVNPTRTGTQFGTQYSQGITETRGANQSAGTQIGNSANQGAGSIRGTGTGTQYGTQYSQGVRSQEGAARSGGTALATGANSGASSISGHSAGSSFGSGFVSGISSWVSGAINAAVNLASSALNAARNFIQSRSPARKTIELGKNFGQGFAVGIGEEIEPAEKVATALTESALGALDIGNRIKDLDLTDILGRLNSAISTRHEIVGGQVAARVETGSTNNTELRDLKQRYSELLATVSALAKVANRPLLATFNVDRDEMARTLVNPMTERMQRDETIKRMMRGER